MTSHSIPGSCVATGRATRQSRQLSLFDLLPSSTDSHITGDTSLSVNMPVQANSRFPRKNAH